MIGDSDPSFLVPNSHESIAERMGMTPGMVRAEIFAAVEFWRKWSSANAKKDAPEKMMKAALPMEEALHLMAMHGFNHEDYPLEVDRLFIGQRILDLQGKLEDDEGRVLAQSAIRMELQLRAMDSLVLNLQDDIKHESVPSVKGELRKELKDLTGMITSQRAQYLAAMKALEATQAQNPNQRRKVAFGDCLGQLVRAIQEYEAKGDSALVDGVFTALEVELLMRPMSLRPVQYRPDIVAIVNDSMKHENLWNPEYESPVMPRHVYRKFSKAWRDAASSLQEDERVVDMEEGIKIDEEEESEQVVMGDLSTTESAPVVESDAVPVRARRVNRGRRSVGDDFDFA